MELESTHRDLLESILHSSLRRGVAEKNEEQVTVLTGVKESAFEFFSLPLQDHP
jgi:hypothetical protein